MTNEIFNKELINACRERIDTYNTNRSRLGKPFCLWASGETLRCLPELDGLLANASTHKHCAYILIYLYNAMHDSRQHNAETFFDVTKVLRNTIYTEIKNDFPGILQQLNGSIARLEIVLQRQKQINETDGQEDRCQDARPLHTRRIEAYLRALGPEHHSINYTDFGGGRGYRHADLTVSVITVRYESWTLSSLKKRPNQPEVMLSDFVEKPNLLTANVEEAIAKVSKEPVVEEVEENALEMKGMGARK